MDGEFATVAARLAGLAGAVLGWRPDDFWNATPADLAAVIATLAPEATDCAGSTDLARMMESFPDG